jgi:hypothetical protein
MNTGYQVMLQFAITQHVRDLSMMMQLVEFFGCGYVTKDGPTKVQFRIRNFMDLLKLSLPRLRRGIVR